MIRFQHLTELFEWVVELKLIESDKIDRFMGYTNDFHSGGIFKNKKIRKPSKFNEQSRFSKKIYSS